MADRKYFQEQIEDAKSKGLDLASAVFRYIVEYNNIDWDGALPYQEHDSEMRTVIGIDEIDKITGTFLRYSTRVGGKVPKVPVFHI